MHILIGFLGVVAAMAIWWWRLKYLGEAATEAIDTVSRVRGNYRRKKLRQQAELSPIVAIDDPVVAAATILVAIHGEDHALLPIQEEAIHDTLAEIAASEVLEEALIYAKWATSQVTDTHLVVSQTGKFLASRLDEREKEQLVEMVGAVVDNGGEAPHMLKLRTELLRQKLGLTIR